MATETPAEPKDLVRRSEARRREVSEALDPKHRVKFGQYFTPAPAADFLVSLAAPVGAGASEEIRVLDAGAGTGSLTASVVTRILRDRPSARIRLTVCELDQRLSPPLTATLADCVEAVRASGGSMEVDFAWGDFTAWATEDVRLFGERRGPFDLVVMNPPYRKLAAKSRERGAVAEVATETSNLYSAFMALGVHLLAPEGQLVAITPRSFTNGPYFRRFRQFFLDRMRIDRVHVFDERNKVFADTDVLQENVILAATRTESSHREYVTVSSSASDLGDLRSRQVPHEQMVHPDDPERFIHLSAEEEDTQLAQTHAALPATLDDLALRVSTGRVVDFRSKEHLRADPVPGSVPLIYPLHMAEGTFVWPIPGAKKCNALMLNASTEKMTFPRGHYVVVKRLSSKEEKRRTVAAVFDPSDVACDRVAFENHVNVVHAGGAGLPLHVARGLCLWLNSTLLDRLLRRFSGHTQVNATDLRNLRYPSRDQLSAMEKRWEVGNLPAQEEIDDMVGQALAYGTENAA